MDINIIKNHNNLIKVYPKGKMIVEESLKDFSNGSFYFKVFNPEKNTLTDICDCTGIGVTYRIINCIYKSEDIYCLRKDSTDSEYYLFKYNINNIDCTRLFSLKELGVDFELNQFIRIFVLTDKYFLIQTEIKVEAQSDNLMGHIAFTQLLFEIDSKSIVTVHDENMNNNGINCIIPLSANQIMIKTGFSYFEDPRYIAGKEYEAVIESVFVNMTSKFISDITLQNSSIDMELIDSTYFKQYIYKPFCHDDYILFTIVDPINKRSDSVFYNYITKEKYTCRNTNFDENDLSMGYVLNKTPYERNISSLQTDFLNLKTMEYDFSCMGKEFIEIIGDLLVVGDVKTNGRIVTQIYSYPNLDLIHEERGTFITGCINDDKYYLYFEK